MNGLNLFRFLIFVGGPLAILIGCIIFLSPFLMRISMSTFFFLD